MKPNKKHLPVADDEVLSSTLSSSSLVWKAKKESDDNNIIMVRPFVSKIYSMLTDRENSPYCKFKKEGLEFSIVDKKGFENIVLNKVDLFRFTHICIKYM